MFFSPKTCNQISCITCWLYFILSEHLMCVISLKQIDISNYKLVSESCCHNNCNIFCLIVLHYIWTKKYVYTNNCSNINKMNNYLLPQIIEHEKEDHADIFWWKSMSWLGEIIVHFYKVYFLKFDTTTKCSIKQTT